MVIASAHWDSCVHFLHHFSPETPRWKPPWLYLGKHKKFSICEKWYASTWKTFLKTQTKTIAISSCHPTQTKNDTNIRSENGSFPRFVSREVLSFLLGGTPLRRKIRCFLAPESRSHSGWVRVLTVPRCFLDGSWWLPPRYLEDPGIPESSLVCKICARFFHFFTRKKP